MSTETSDKPSTIPCPARLKSDPRDEISKLDPHPPAISRIDTATQSLPECGLLAENSENDGNSAGIGRETEAWDPNMLIGKLGYYHYTTFALSLILGAFQQFAQIP